MSNQNILVNKKMNFQNYPGAINFGSPLKRLAELLKGFREGLGIFRFVMSF